MARLPTVLMVLWLPLLAQDPAVRARKIVDDAIQALGGQTFLTMQDRVETGRAYSFYNSQLSGMTVARFYTRYLTRPEPPVPGFFGIREKQVLGKDDSYFFLFNDTGSYEVTYRGAQPVSDDLDRRFHESALHNIFYMLRMRLGEPGLEMEAKGADVFNNQPVEIVEFFDNDNRQVIVSFHRSTKLPVKQVYVRRDPKTRQRFEEVSLFSKYRDIGGGVQWPFAVRRERNGEKIFEMFSESVVINQSLTDEVFTLSAKVKVLEKKK